MTAQLGFSDIGRVPLDIFGNAIPRPARSGRTIDLSRRFAPPSAGAPVKLRALAYRKDVRFVLAGAQAHVATDGMKIDAAGAPVPGGVRGEIRGFSSDSARRLRFVIRQSADLFKAFVTLTYPTDWQRWGGDGRTIKAHVNAFCTWLRELRFCAYCGAGYEPRARRCSSCSPLGKPAKWTRCAYVWVLEFQRRGAPHFHFVISGRIDKDLLSRRWFEIVGSGDLDHLAAGTQIKRCKNPDHAGGYMGAYVSKLEQKHVPKGFLSVGRFWGASRILGRFIECEFDGAYAEAAVALRVWRKQTAGARRGISATQAQRAAEHIQEAAQLRRRAEILPEGDERAKIEREALKAEAAARACASFSRSYGRRWRWRGLGFVALESARHFKAMLARQCALADMGVDVWRLAGERIPREYVPPALRGQLMLDGSLDPDYAPDFDTPGMEAWKGSSR